VITGIWAFILAVICFTRVYRACQVGVTKMFFRITPGVLLYSLLVIVEAVDYTGVYGLYNPTVPVALRILETDILAVCSFGAMHLMLTIAFSMEQKTAPAYSTHLFIAASILKLAIGVATAVAYLIVQEKKVLVENDAALLVTFIISISLFIWLSWQVQLRLGSHLQKVSSDVLSKSLVKMRRILVLTAIAAVVVPGFLAYNLWQHEEQGDVTQAPPNPAVYEPNLEPSVFFKLVWASFLIWLSRPSNSDQATTTVTEAESKGAPPVVRLQTNDKSDDGNPQPGNTYDKPAVLDSDPPEDGE